MKKLLAFVLIIGTWSFAIAATYTRQGERVIKSEEVEVTATEEKLVQELENLNAMIAMYQARIDELTLKRDAKAEELESLKAAK